MEKNNSVSALENDKTELENQYSPSRWSKRFNSAEAVIEAHIAFVSSASEEARGNVPYEVLRYGESENQLVDIFGTTLPNNSPILVYVHGGYWQDLERSISAYLVRSLFEKGIRVAVVGYDLAPRASFARIVEETAELDRFLISWSAKTGTKCIWYAGHSAGAYLIATILKSRAEKECITSECPIRGMIFVSGIYDLLPLVDTYVNNNLKLTRDEAQQRSLTDIKLEGLTAMTFLIVVAEHDSREFHRQSSEFYKMLCRETPNVEYLVIKQTDHFDIVEKLNDGHYELTQKIVNLILSK